ncbi:DUF5130 family protein [Streptosporangiaceae bacterium NEAU-GS5]|nr:DUF5130 family protein [Streptosporangiaceae bacterium NEAU-GS5]
MRALSSLQTDDIRSALTLAERRSGLRFAIYVGPIRPMRRHFAERMHAALGDDAARAVLLVVDTVGRGLEIVTGERARERLSDGQCRLAAMAMATAFSAGNLVNGLVAGLGTLSDQASRKTG